MNILSELFFINPNIKKFSKITEKDKLINKKVKINISSLENFNLPINGFEYVKFDSKITNIISRLSKNNFSTNVKKHNPDVQSDIDKLHKYIKQYLYKFLNEKTNSNINRMNDHFTNIVILESVFRNSKIDQKKFTVTKSKVNPSAGWIHTDWWESQTFTSILTSRLDWINILKDQVPNSKEFCDLNNYDNFKKLWDSRFIDIYNIWIPLSEDILDSPLTILDKQTLNYSDMVPLISECIINKNKYFNEIVTKLKYNKEQKWHSKIDMTLGEGVIFNSIKNPHSAFKVDNKSHPARQSIEIRCAVFNFDIEPECVYGLKTFK